MVLLGTTTSEPAGLTIILHVSHEELWLESPAVVAFKVYSPRGKPDIVILSPLIVGLTVVYGFPSLYNVAPLTPVELTITAVISTVPP